MLMPKFRSNKSTRVSLGLWTSNIKLIAIIQAIIHIIRNVLLIYLINTFKILESLHPTLLKEKFRPRNLGLLPRTSSQDTTLLSY